jgi:RimJ/RimL family protein N-acetyltransferase
MRIALRPARPDDAEEMARWFADLASLAEWGGPEVRFPLTDDQVAAWIEEGSNERPRICFTAVDDGDRPVGHVQFLRDPPRRWARLGRFGIAPARRGKGFGRALFDAAVRMAFDEFEVERLALAVVPTNERAFRLYLGSGFSDEGATPGSWTVGGKPYVMHTMSLTRPDWLRLTGAHPGAVRVG